MARRPDIVGFDSQRPTARSRMGAYKMVSKSTDSYPLPCGCRRPLPNPRSTKTSPIIVKWKEPLFGNRDGRCTEQICHDLLTKTLRDLQTRVGPITVSSPFSDWVIEYLRLSRNDNRRTDRPDPASDLLSFFQIQCQDATQVPIIYRQLARVAGAGPAYQPRPLTLPNTGQETTCKISPIPKPLYFEPAPVGMSIEAIWHLPGGKGQGQELVDIEVGWMLDHVELAGKSIELIYGINNPVKADHGLSMLCTVCGANKFATVGVAPQVTNIKLASDTGPESTGLLSDSIVAAVSGMSYGSVLLIEIASVAVEFEPLNFYAIQLASKKGIVVIEPAGNLDTDYDAYKFEVYDFSLCSFTPQGHVTCPSPKVYSLNPAGNSYIGDSGAIVVSVGTHGGPKSETPISTYYSAHGARINCFVTADNYSSCGLKHNADYVCQGGGATSTASAAIAGAALVVQGIAEAHLGVRLPPLWVRSLLSHLGTKNDDASTKPIGVMPDLRQIATHILKMKIA